MAHPRMDRVRSPAGAPSPATATVDMADGRKAPLSRLPLLAASALALMLASAPLMPTPAFAEVAKPACSGFSHIVILRDQPVQLNPGAKCGMQISVEVTTKEAKPCLNVRQAGKKDTLGPFCLGEANTRLPPAIEWAWSADKPLRAWVILTAPRGVPRAK